MRSVYCTDFLVFFFDICLSYIKIIMIIDYLLLLSSYDVQ